MVATRESVAVSPDVVIAPVLILSDPKFSVQVLVLPFAAVVIAAVTRTLRPTASNAFAGSENVPSVYAPVPVPVPTGADRL